VELRPVQGSADQLEAVRSQTRLAVVHWAEGDRGVGALVVLDPESDVTVDDVYDIAAALAYRAASRGAGRLLLTSPTVVVRHAAREYGGYGRLRDPVELNLERAVRAPFRGGNRSERAAILTQALTEFGITVVPVRPPGPIGRVSRRLTGGVGDTIRMKIGWGPGRTFTLSVPDRPDLMPEGVARIADTAVSVARRFPIEGGSIREIAVDRSEWGLSKGEHSGVAALQEATIHLNTGHVLAYSAMELHRQRAAETKRAMDRRIAKRQVSGAPQLPFVAADATTAHEMWHLIEAVFEAKRFKQSIEFRRQLGRHLGVETLEHAVKGHEQNAPDNWKAACARLSDEVSPYATTSADEASAELFKAWWCRTGDLTPVVSRFGELLDEFFVPPAE
jgi:hypothetical protein